MKTAPVPFKYIAAATSLLLRTRGEAGTFIIRLEIDPVATAAVRPIRIKPFGTLPNGGKHMRTVKSHVYTYRRSDTQYRGCPSRFDYFLFRTEARTPGSRVKCRWH